MPHFFIDSKACVEGLITIDDKNNYNHIAKSLRSKIGETLLLIDDKQIQYEGVIEKITSNSILVKVQKSYPSKRMLDFDLFLAQSPLRSDAQTLVVEKATELGVKGLYPLFTDNCSLNKNVIENKIAKWQKTMSEASKQCERADIPTCFELSTIDEVVKKFSDYRILVFLERRAEYPLKKYLRENPIFKNEKILVIIGPEGGFSKKEFEFFEENNVITLSLGELILKAETAVVTALGNIIYEYE